jgi:hypothetical protein
LAQRRVGSADDLAYRRGPPTRAAVSRGDAFLVERRGDRRQRPPSLSHRNDSGDDSLVELDGPPAPGPWITQKHGKPPRRQTDIAQRRTTLARLPPHAPIDRICADPEQARSFSSRYQPIGLAQQLPPTPRQFLWRRPQPAAAKASFGHADILIA